METAPRRVRHVMVERPPERVNSPAIPEHRSKSDRRARRRPSVDEVFGDVLPDTTGDERADSGSEDPRAGGGSDDGRDEELLRDVPLTTNRLAQTRAQRRALVVLGHQVGDS